MGAPDGAMTRGSWRSWPRAKSHEKKYPKAIAKPIANSSAKPMAKACGGKVSPAAKAAVSKTSLSCPPKVKAMPKKRTFSGVTALDEVL